MRTTWRGGVCSASSATATGSRLSACASDSSPARSTGRLLLRVRQAGPDRTERLRLLWPGRERTKPALPKSDAAPFPELEADPFIGADLMKAEPLVQPHGGFIGQGDRGDRLGVTLTLEHRQKRAVEQGADAAPLRPVRDINCGLDAEPVGRPGAEGAGIGIAGHRAGLGIAGH